jgi:tRNA A-37 threonylcarbamoyl transferase component Bud32
MRICPKCRTAYPLKGRSTCASDGTRLVEADEFARAQSDPLLGQTIAGRFRVIERIGTGGMGTVYRAEQSGLGRSVALKVLKKELISDRDTVARFHREAKAMSMLMHPNTVRVFDFGEDDRGYLFLAMELLEGELLTAWIEREGAPPIEQAVGAAQEVLRSLAEAHSKGIIHRDLKPDNIFLARVDGHARPVVKVLDFGIAKVFRDDQKIDALETQAGTVFGTPRYMSPEQAQGKVLDHRSDLYSVGVLLYQLLTGRPPFIDDDAVVVMAKHIRDVPDSPCKAAADRPIPRSLDKLVMRALAKEPEQRFDSADEMEAKLGALIPDVRAEAAKAATLHKAGSLAALRMPLAIAGVILTVAITVAIVMVVSSTPDDVAQASDIERIARERAPRTAAPPIAAEPATTSVTLTSAPSGAQIWWGDRMVGTTPHVFDLGASETLRLTVRADGHEPADVQLTSEAAPSQAVTLVAIPIEVRPEPPPEREPHEGTRPRVPRDPQPVPLQQQTSNGDPYERFD